MKFLRKFANIISPILMVLMIYTVIPIVPAFASIATTDQMIDLQAATSDRAKVSGFLAREDVRRQTTDFGVDPADVEQRVNALSDEEIGDLARNIDEMPAGQGVVGLLVFVAVVLFLVFAITDMAGATDVFPSINGPNERR